MPAVGSLLIRLQPGLLPWIDVLGYAASLLVLTTFCMNTMLRLRWVAIGSNVLFILFGYFARIYPVMILHVILFPVNLVRLVQIYRLVQSAVRADGNGLSFQALLPFMTKREFLAGATLVHKGEMADRLFYVSEGRIRVVEPNKILESGAVIGEIGVFAPDHRRTATVVCITDCVIYELSERKALELYYQNPSFGYAVLQLIITRLLENQQLAPAAASPVETTHPPHR